jgi:mitogen-activated protein kinase kinase kinase 1
MKHSSYPAEDDGADDLAPVDLGPEFASQTSFRIRRGGAEVADLFRKLGLKGPEDFTIPPAVYAAAMAHIPNSSRSRRQSLEAPPPLPPGAGAEGMEPAPPGPPDVSGRDAAVAARLDAAVEGEEQAVLASKVVQPEVAEVSARSYKEGSARSYRAVQLETGESSRRAIAAVVKERTADGMKGKGDVVKVDQLRVERTKAVVVEAPRETTAAVVQAVAESPSRSTKYLISPSPNRRFKKTITSWLRGQHLGSGSFGSVYEAISE